MSILGRDDAVVTEWLLKADQFRGELKELAREVQAEQRNEKQLETVRAALQRQTDALNNTTHELTSQMGRFNETLSKVGYGMPILAGGVAGLAAVGIPKLVGALGDAVGGMIDLVKAGDDFNDSVGDNADRVFRMAEAAQHFITSQEALRLEQKLSEGQLQLTEEQYDAFARAATQYAHTMKVDSATAVDALADAYLRGSDRALKPLGIDIQNANTLLEKQTEILKQIGKVTDANLTQKEKEEALEKKVSDARLEAATKIAKVPIVSEWMQMTDEQWPILKAQLWKQAGEEAERFSVGMDGIKDRFVAAEKATDRFLTSLTEFNGAKNWDMREKARNLLLLQTAFKDLDEQIRKDIDSAEELADQVSIDRLLSSPLVSPGQSESKRALLGEKRKSAVAPKSRRGSSVERGGYSPYEDVDKGPLFGEGVQDVLMQADAAKSLLEAELAADSYRQSLVAASEAQAEFSRWVKIANGNVLEQMTAMADADKVYSELKSEVYDLAVGAMGELAAGMWSAADAALAGGDSFASAMAKMLKSTLLGIAQQATVKAVFETAEGFATLGTTWGVPNPASIAHFTSAGIFTGIAALTGGAGLAMSAAGVGRDAGTKSTAGSSRGGYSDDGGYKPSFGSKSESKQPLHFHLYLGDPDDPGAAWIATKQLQVQLKAA